MFDQSEMHNASGSHKNMSWDSPPPLVGTFWRKTAQALNLDQCHSCVGEAEFFQRFLAAVAEVHKSSVALEKP